MDGKTITSVVIRSGPSTSFPKLKSLAANLEIKIITVDKMADGSQWAKMDVWKGPKPTDYWRNVFGIVVGSDGTRYIEVYDKSSGKDINQGDGKQGEEKIDVDDIIKNVSGIDKTMEGFLNYVNGSDTAFKGTLKLFGSPFQFTDVVDCRVPSVSNIIGRTYIENIGADSPIVTIIPGKPDYLPNSKNKRATGAALISAAGGAFTNMNSQKISDDELRYFDFQSDYLEYIKYVNMLCRTSAGLLEISKYKFMGVELGSFDWASYRYDQDKYKSSIATLTSGIGSIMGGALKDVASGITKLMGGGSAGGGKILTGDKTDVTLQNSIEQLFVNMNFVQFYVDPSSGKTESAGNSTSQSMLDSGLQRATDTTKELQFLANAGGINADSIQNDVEDALRSIGNMMPGDNPLTGVLGRILHLGGTLVQGDNLLLPEIYQRSDWSESYSITINLKTPYMDKLSYYINIVVPLMHILALVLPKQSTANTAAAPFIIKSFIPGVYTSSMGIVESVSIEKASSGDSWSIDGYPSEIRISMSIKDLYSAMSITPSTDVRNFITNTSLIDYLGVTAGVDLTKPNITKRANMYIDTILEAIGDIPDNAAALITEKVQHTLEKFYKLGK